MLIKKEAHNLTFGKLTLEIKPRSDFSDISHLLPGWLRKGRGIPLHVTVSECLDWGARSQLSRTHSPLEWMQTSLGYLHKVIPKWIRFESFNLSFRQWEVHSHWHSSHLGNHWQLITSPNIVKDKEAWCATVHGVTQSWTQLSDFHFHFS